MSSDSINPEKLLNDEEFSGHDILSNALNDKKNIDKAIELAVALVLFNAGVPVGNAVEPMANTNSRVPLTCGILLAFEKRLNELLGVCETIGGPLYPPMTFFSELIHNYLRLTPSVQGTRAEQILNILGGGGAIARMPDTGTHIDMGEEELAPLATKPKEDML